MISLRFSPHIGVRHQTSTMHQKRCRNGMERWRSIHFELLSRVPACGNILSQYSPALIRRAQEGRADGLNPPADLQVADQCAKPGSFDGQPFPPIERPVDWRSPHWEGS